MFIEILLFRSGGQKLQNTATVCSLTAARAAHAMLGKMYTLHLCTVLYDTVVILLWD